MPANRAPRGCRRLATCLVVVSLAVAAPMPSDAGDAPTPVALQSLESAFWRCDFTASELGLEYVDVRTCVDVYETLKRTKFDGDFGRLLAWWQAHKPAEHAKLRAGRPVQQQR